jgi:hypothetical protein
MNKSDFIKLYGKLAYDDLVELAKNSDMEPLEYWDQMEAELEAERISSGYYEPFVSKYGTEYKQMKDFQNY